MTIIHLSILSLAVLLTGGLVLIKRIENPLALKMILAFSGAFILSLCIFHLLPEVYEGLKDRGHLVGWCIAGGFMIQLILDYFSGGIEHGHIHPEDTLSHTHVHEHTHEHTHEGLKRFPYLLMAGLCIHAFLEGLPLLGNQVPEGLFTGILLHNIPIAITLMTLFSMSGASKLTSFGALFIFAIMTPLGALSASFIFPSNHHLSNDFGYIALSFVIGIFLHISTTILFESDQNHRFNFIKFSVIIAGFIAATLVH